MKKLAFMNTISRSAHRMAFKLQKHSPEIHVVAGVIGAVASAVMACKATTKLSDILDDSRDRIDSIHDVIENPDFKPGGRSIFEVIRYRSGFNG